MARPLRGALPGVDIGGANPVCGTLPISPACGATWRYDICALAVWWLDHDGCRSRDVVFDTRLAPETMDFLDIRGRLAPLRAFLGRAS